VDSVFDWYWLGVGIGLGVTAGISGFRRGGPTLGIAVTALAALAAGVLAALVFVWTLIGYGAGLAVGLLSFRRLSGAAVPAAVVAAATLAFVPGGGYLEALAAPFLGRRLTRRAGERYAGLRILAKD
jgi:hypothetical protein